MRGDAETFKVQQLRAMDQTKEGFARVDSDIKDLRSEMKEGFAKVDKRFEKVNDEFTSVRREMSYGFDRMQRSLLVFASAIIAALITAPHL